MTHPASDDVEEPFLDIDIVDISKSESDLYKKDSRLWGICCNTKPGLEPSKTPGLPPPAVLSTSKLQKKMWKIRGRTYPFFEDIISYPYPGPKKRILYTIHIQAQKKDMDIYPISYIHYASIVTVSEQPKARPGSTAAHKSMTFYLIELTPWSISSAARKLQITAEMA
jgi:hypothetical protein